MDYSQIMNQEENNNDYKNDLFTIFFDRLFSLYIKREYDEIEKILIGTNESKSYSFVSKNTNGAKYIDENSAIPVRVWTDSETKRFLEVLHYVCKDENTIVLLNSKMIELWLYEMNSEMSRFFYRTKNIECERECYITIGIEKEKWSEFIKRTKLFKITIPDGFKDCINMYLRQKSKMYL